MLHQNYKLCLGKSKTSILLQTSKRNITDNISNKKRNNDINKIVYLVLLLSRTQLIHKTKKEKTKTAKKQHLNMININKMSQPAWYVILCNVFLARIVYREKRTHLGLHQQSNNSLKKNIYVYNTNIKHTETSLKLHDIKITLTTFKLHNKNHIDKRNAT